MKKILLSFLCIAFVFCMTGCGTWQRTKDSIEKQWEDVVENSDSYESDELED